MDGIDVATAAAQGALLLSMQLVLPILAVGLVVGLIMSIFQAVTQIQEQMVSFLPKIIAMAAALFVLLPWLLSLITGYARSILGGLSSCS